MGVIAARPQSDPHPPEAAGRSSAGHRHRWKISLSPAWLSTRLGPLVDVAPAGDPDSGLGREPNPSPRDAENLLVAVARERDRQAFASLFTFFAPRLKGYLVTRGSDAATAEEIIQDVMLTLWHKADQFDPGRGAAAAWIFTLARNAFVDRVRRERRPAPDPGDPLLEPASTDGAPDRLIDAGETRLALAQALGDLPSEQQQVVQRSYFHGQSLAQIAVADGLPLGTVKTRARLALARLRVLVGDRRET